MKYIIVSHSKPNNQVHTIYDRAEDLTIARNKCEQLAADHPGSTFSYYEWTGGFGSRTEVLTERLWHMPEVFPLPLEESNDTGDMDHDPT